MMKRLVAKTTPMLLSLGLLSVATLPMSGCGTDELGSYQEELLAETKSAQINQTDLNGYTNSVKLSACTFAIAGGTGTFTPSNELAGVLYGDPNGAAHKTTFAVPVVSTPDVTLEIKNFTADMTKTGITLAGSNATVKLAFSGLLRVEVQVPVFGKLPAELEIRPSSLSVALAYDATTERVKVASVTAAMDVKTKKCGGSGWCNGIVDKLLKDNMKKMIEAPLQDALGKALDKPSVTDGLNKGLVIMYNAKDKKPTAWTMVPKTLTLSGGAFNFTVSRP